MPVFELTATTSVKLKALVTTPPDFDPEKESLPMIVFLHGAGERGDDLSRVHQIGLAKYFVEDPCYGGHRVITVSPQCPEELFWSALPREIYQVIEEAATRYNVDRDRISITGLSMGGFGTWEMICTYPDLFAAAAPVCGGGISWRAPWNLKCPIRAFHGDADDCVPLVYSQLMVDTINRNGGNAQLTIFHGVEHDSWTNAYEETNLIEWLANAKRQ